MLSRRPMPPTQSIPYRPLSDCFRAYSTARHLFPPLPPTNLKLCCLALKSDPNLPCILTSLSPLSNQTGLFFFPTTIMIAISTLLIIIMNTSFILLGFIEKWIKNNKTNIHVSSAQLKIHKAELVSIFHLLCPYVDPLVLNDLKKKIPFYLHMTIWLPPKKRSGNSLI